MEQCFAPLLKVCLLGSCTNRNFILGLINLSSTGIGLILVWQRETHTSAKSAFYSGTTKKKRKKTCRHQCVCEIRQYEPNRFQGPEDHETNQQKVQLLLLQEALRCAAQSHRGVPRKAISSGQAQQTLIKSEAERQTARQM